MGVNSRCGDSVLGNIGCYVGLQCSANQAQPLSSSICPESAHDESLNIKEVGQASINGKGIGNDYSADAEVDIDVGAVAQMCVINGVEKGNIGASSNGHEGKCKTKCLEKCATFPCMSEVKPRDGSSEMEEEEPETALRWLFGEEHYNQAYSRSVSLPSPLKLLSAMKGSREKEGLSTEKLAVKWAADVCDPPVTLMSHTVNSNKQQKSRKNKNWKKDGKKGQKGNSSRGKDKKHRKGGAPERSRSFLDPHEMITDDNDEFLVGSRELPSYCGSSFLKNSITSMHYPVAEAL